MFIILMEQSHVYHNGLVYNYARNISILGGINENRVFR